MPTNWLTLIWYGGAAVFGLLGLFLLMRWLIGDRSKGRRRCPKCWYDMSATSGLQCPECGKTAKSEKGLFRARRRRREAVLGAVLVLVSGGILLALYVQQYVNKHGWMPLTPTTVLLRRASGQMFNGAPDTDTLELMRRLGMPGVWRWQWHEWIDKQRALSQSDVIRAPKTWPADLPVRVNIALAWFFGTAECERIIVLKPLWPGGVERRHTRNMLYPFGMSGELGLPPTSGTPADVEVLLYEQRVRPDGTRSSERLCFRDTVRLPVAAGSTLANSALQAVDAAAQRDDIEKNTITSLLLTNAPNSPRAMAQAGFKYLNVDLLFPYVSELGQASVAANIHIFLGDEEIGSWSGAALATYTQNQSLQQGFEFSTPIKDAVVSRIANAPHPPELRFVITSDPNASAAMAVLSKLPQYWTGSVEIRTTGMKYDGDLNVK